MELIFVLLLFSSFISLTQSVEFSAESPYLAVRLMDLKVHEWKLNTLNKMEKALDAELKYTDEKKGVACASIVFEQEVNYPKTDGRFLDISIRGICIDDKGTQHNIEKVLLINAIIRRKDEVGRAVNAAVYKVGHAKVVYSRTRNKLNLIIIPTSISFVVLLFVLTFFLRRMRNKQKHRHIVSELQKKKEASVKKAQTIANIDPLASDKQRLLQLDPTVVGNVSNTMGSPKEFTNEQSNAPNRTNATNSGIDHRYINREHQGGAPPSAPLSSSTFPNKENRASYQNRENDASIQIQRPLQSSRERIPVPYENESRFSPTNSQYSYEPQYPEMVSMHEHHPRVVVRSIRDDNNYSNYHQQPYEDSSKAFVSIPVQIEHSSPHQRFVPPPYHSDPYYPNMNS